MSRLAAHGSGHHTARKRGATAAIFSEPFSGGGEDEPVETWMRRLAASTIAEAARDVLAMNGARRVLAGHPNAGQRKRAQAMIRKGESELRWFTNPESRLGFFAAVLGKDRRFYTRLLLLKMDEVSR